MSLCVLSGSNSTHSSNEMVGLRFGLSSGGGGGGAFPCGVAAAPCAAETAASVTGPAQKKLTTGRMDESYPISTAQPLIPSSQECMVRPAGDNFGGGDLSLQLERIAGLHRSGALTDAEYELAKAKLLAG